MDTDRLFMWQEAYGSLLCSSFKSLSDTKPSRQKAEHRLRTMRWTFLKFSKLRQCNWNVIFFIPDPWMGAQMIAETLGLAKSIVNGIITEELQMREICDKLFFKSNKTQSRNVTSTTVHLQFAITWLFLFPSVKIQF